MYIQNINMNHLYYYTTDERHIANTMGYKKE